MNKNFTFSYRIVECSGTLSTTGDYKAVCVKTASEPQTKPYMSVHLSLATCEAIATVAYRDLQRQNLTGARRSFAQAEAAFAEAHEDLQKIGRADWRQQIERTLNRLGSKLDQLWVKLMSATRLQGVGLSGLHCEN